MIKGKSKIVLAILVIIGFGIGVYFLLGGSDSSLGGLSALKELEFRKTGARFIPNGWQEFRSELHGFSILHQGDLAIKQFDEGGGASTITFENASSSLGFQIFVVPYGEEKISSERFLRDSPLGVMENTKDLKVDGATATSFYGKSAVIGDTWEIWFIHNSLLYEITVPRNLEKWFSSIMETWLFLAK